jgi:transposase-like protein
MKDLYAKVYEQLLESEMDAHLGYVKHSKSGNNTSNSRNGKYIKQLQSEHGEQKISVPRDHCGDFESIIRANTILYLRFEWFCRRL